MNILFVSNCCEQKRFNDLMEKLKDPEQNAQKLHGLLIRGMAKASNTEVHAISMLPINSHNYPYKHIPAEEITVDNCHYHHVEMWNLPVLRNLHSFFHCFHLIRKLTKGKRKETVVICDILRLGLGTSVQLACKLLGLASMGIVTDVPQKRAEKGNILNRAIDAVRFHQLKSYDSYIFLTEQMNNLINSKGKPYVVIEGTVDSDVEVTENTLEGKHSPRLCVYSGSIRKIYGVQALTEGFLKANIPNTELWIYGNGDYRDELEDVCRKHSNVRYFGVVPNSEVVKTQLKATLLVNPRPPIGEYTKYSFPSKNMEYLVSGTPVLAVMLPGMPEEYRQYLFELKDCSANGICEMLRGIFQLSNEDLMMKGQTGKNFVLKEKNHLAQGQRIIKLAQCVIESRKA